MSNDDIEIVSEPCFAHMLVDGHVVDPGTARDVARFRKAERTRLYAMRKSVPLDLRHRMAATVSEKLQEEIGPVSGKTIAVYWPIRGELDLRGWMGEIHSTGATVALPVVVERQQPVEFRNWAPDCQMRRGVWNIPVPENTKTVIPDLVVVPLLGVDEERYRLGNGGGYYDRTLARLPGGTVAIGVGHEFSKMKTIFPMPWDVPMDKVVLGDGSVF